MPTCNQCGTPLSEETTGGLCPRCLAAVGAGPETLPGSGFPPPTPAELASAFPGFEIVETLGRGGMGIVYKARQKNLDRTVALKILATEKQDDPAFAETFAREARVLARLNHPHIVTIHDSGEAGGFFYLVMEYVDGANLREVLRGGKIPAEQALAIVPPVCEALQYAHDQGVVHRDIKPENILLDREGNAKIADFGIASLAGSGETVTGGTPGYVAPEETADHRADIFALGTVLYELLTGEQPDQPLTRPSKKVQIDVRLDDVVLRALEVEPEKRYQTAAEFGSALGDPPAKEPAKIALWQYVLAYSALVVQFAFLEANANFGLAESLLFLGTFAWLLTLWCKLLYRFWASLPEPARPTTPARTVGFCFLPVFNIYWAFTAYHKLGKLLSPALAPLSLTCAISMAANGSIGYLPFVGIFTMLFDLVVTTLFFQRAHALVEGTNVSIFGKRSVLKRSAARVSVLAITGTILAGGWSVFSTPPQTARQGTASVFTPADPNGRSIRVHGMHQGMLDSDGDATIIHADGTVLRFEADRLLIDGYTAAPLLPGQRSVEVRFSGDEIGVTSGGAQITRQRWGARRLPEI